MIRSRRPDGRRKGFALLAVLWVFTGVAVLGLGAALAARAAVGTATNRADMVRAFWHAEDCLARTRVLAAEVLTDRAVDGSGHKVDWARLDRYVRSSWLAAQPDCDVILRPTGVTLDVNAADAEALHALFRALGVLPGRADSLTDAMLDWRDADDIPRPLGAEREWYESHGRHLPRNGPFADSREFRRVRGLESIPDLEGVLDVEPGRISLVHAPPEVLAALPGFGPEAVQRVLDLRRIGRSTIDLPAVASGLSPSARRLLLDRFPDAVERSTPEPEGWIVEARGYAGVPPVTVVVEVKLVRAGPRAAIVRRRIWLR